MPVTQAAAGIVVSVLGTAVFCLAGFWLFLRHRRSKEDRLAAEAEETQKIIEAGALQRAAVEEAKRRGFQRAGLRHSDGSHRQHPRQAAVAAGANARRGTPEAHGAATIIDGHGTGVATAPSPSTMSSVRSGSAVRQMQESPAPAGLAPQPQRPRTIIGYATSDFSGAPTLRSSTADYSSSPAGPASSSRLSLMPGVRVTIDDGSVYKAPFFQQRLGRVEEEGGARHSRSATDIRQSWKSGLVNPMSRSPPPGFRAGRGRGVGGWPISGSGDE